MRRSFKQSIIHAVSGVRVGFMRERNVRIHFVAAILVIVAAWWKGMDRIEWAILLLAIAIVMVAEFINTSIEFLGDIMNPRVSSAVEHLKDVSAGGVLLASVLAAAIAAAMFIF